MLKELKVKVNVSKGSVLTGNAWIDVLFGGEKVVEHAEVTALFKPIDEVKTNVIEFTIEQFDDSFQNTLTILNSPETIGPIQIYGVEFYLDGENAGVTWQTATKEKPLRFGGQPSVIITNPHVGDPNFGGWSSVTDVSPGMSITWGLADLVAVVSI